MSKTIAKKKNVKKEEKILPLRNVILHDVSRMMIGNALLMDDLIEELIDQMS